MGGWRVPPPKVLEGGMTPRRRKDTDGTRDRDSHQCRLRPLKATGAGLGPWTKGAQGDAAGRREGKPIPGLLPAPGSSLLLTILLRTPDNQPLNSRCELRGPYRPLLRPAAVCRLFRCRPGGSGDSRQ